MAASDKFREQMAPAVEDAAIAALVEEACRIIDRLDSLDQIVTGKSEWIQLMRFRLPGLSDEQEVKVSIDGVLAESRQQTVVLRAILGHLGVGKAALSTARKVVDPIDEFTARRAARGAGAATDQGRAGAIPY